MIKHIFGKHRTRAKLLEKIGYKESDCQRSEHQVLVSDKSDFRRISDMTNKIVQKKHQLSKNFRRTSDIRNQIFGKHWIQEKQFSENIGRNEAEFQRQSHERNNILGKCRINGTKFSEKTGYSEANFRNLMSSLSLTFASNTLPVEEGVQQTQWVVVSRHREVIPAPP